ncbi:hypothetical protein IQA64_17385 [Leptospira borgpetersenii serovar Tarassovi]|nr:hypothetical protein [Leptospira borgpetersenii serovar Tarassovi]
MILQFMWRFRQNGAPSGLEKRGLDASIYHKTKKPTEGTKSFPKTVFCGSGIAATLSSVL